MFRAELVSADAAEQTNSRRHKAAPTREYFGNRENMALHVGDVSFGSYVGTSLSGLLVGVNAKFN